MPERLGKRKPPAHAFRFRITATFFLAFCGNDVQRSRRDNCAPLAIIAHPHFRGSLCCAMRHALSITRVRCPPETKQPFLHSPNLAAVDGQPASTPRIYLDDETQDFEQTNWAHASPRSLYI